MDQQRLKAGGALDGIIKALDALNRNDREKQIADVVSRIKKISFRCLQSLLMLFVVLALGLLVFSVFAFAADRALTMPMHLEGF